MSDVLPTIVMMGLGLIGLYFSQRGLDSRREVPLLILAFLAHIFAAFAQVAITRQYYSGGDALGYHAYATVLAELVLADHERFLPEVYALIFQQPVQLPFEIHGVGSSTGTMAGVTTLFALVTGSSIYAICVAYSMIAFTSCRALYQVFRERFEAHLRPRLLLTIMALPSVVFWTSGIVKESLAVSGFAWMVFGMHRVSQGRWVVGLVALVPGLLLATLIKGYVVGAFFVAASVFFYWVRAGGQTGRVRVRPVPMVLVGGVAVVAVLGFGQLFPRYSLTGIVEETSRLQTVGMRIDGGSNYALGQADQSLAAQIVLSPLALATALFRPLPFEVGGFTEAANAVETTFLTGWLLVTLFRQRWRHLVSSVLGSPMLMFCVTFIVLFGVGVGLASTNLGTLSRYRAPLMPLFGATIVILHSLRVAPSAVPLADNPIAARRRGTA